MYFHALVPFLFSIALIPPAASAARNPHLLKATAIVTNEENHSILQCWEFKTPFAVSSSPGTAGAATLDLARLSNVTYTVIPPRFDGGLHTAPYKQLVAFLSGVAHVTLPHSSATATIHGGANGVIVAVDTAGEGHVTRYPSGERTVALQAPFRDGIVPAHRVLDARRACVGAQIEYGE